MDKYVVAQHAVRALDAWSERNAIARSDLARLYEGLSSRPVPGNKFQYGDYIFPGLESMAWIDTQPFDWIRRIEDNWLVIRDEFTAQVQTDSLYAHPEAVNLTQGGSWDSYHLYFTGKPVLKQLDRCPSTANLLAAIPDDVFARTAYFSVMRPGTHVMPHCGFVNLRWRCHLGLSIPDGCTIRVGDEIRTWGEGRCILFDDSFEHEISNSSQLPRSVLLFDVWHPSLTAIERSALVPVFDVWARAAVS